MPHPLRRWRFERGMTLKELAEEVDSSWNTLGKIERGVTVVSTIGIIRRLKARTGLTADQILLGDDEPNGDVSRETSGSDGR